MALPSLEEFKEALLARPAEDVAREVLLSPEIYFFRDWANGVSLLKQHISTALNIDPASVGLVGSGKIGFSTKPNRADFGRAFRAKSDLDIVVVSSTLFDVAWSALLKWHYPHPENDASDADLKWEDEYRRDIYRGYLYPPELKFHTIAFPASLSPLRDLRANWLNAANGLSSVDSRFAKRKIRSRLYRSWDSVVFYHAYGFRKIKQLLS